MPMRRFYTSRGWRTGLGGFPSHNESDDEAATTAPADKHDYQKSTARNALKATGER